MPVPQTKYVQSPYLTYSENDHNCSGLSLNVERILAEPLSFDEKMPFWERPWISHQLHQTLYGGDSDIQTRSKIYALVDPQVRRNVEPADDLQLSELPKVSLIKGEAREELETVAPVLIDISSGSEIFEQRATDPVLSSLFTRFWGARSGIFLRSTAELEELQGHLRRFTRIQREDGRWFYYRFWEPCALTYYLCSLRNDMERISSWFFSRGDRVIDAIFAESRDREAIYVMSAAFEADASCQEAMKLRSIDWQLLSEQVEIDFYTALAEELFARHRPLFDMKQVDAVIRHNLATLDNYGLRERRDIAALNEASLLYGVDLHVRLPFAHVWQDGHPHPAVLSKYVRLWAA